MTDAVRAAIHLERTVDDPRFINVVADRNKVTHVAKLHSESDVDAMKVYLKGRIARGLNGMTRGRFCERDAEFVGVA
jgi:hypothetical protein